MEVSSGLSPSVQVEVMKKAQDTEQQQGQQALKVLDSVNQEAQQMAAQTTGIGGNINITA
jgi:hypothetical protein